jgi:hypothetical protein
MKRFSMVAAVLLVVAGTLGAVGSTDASAAPSREAVALQWKAADSRGEVRALSAAASTQLQAQVDQQLAGTRGGVQISANEVSYHGGDPIVSFPLPGQAQAPVSSAAALKQQGATPSQVRTLSQQSALSSVDWHGCPAGESDNRWYCFYEHANWGGRRLQWIDPHCSSPIYFGDYGFRDQASGWANTTQNPGLNVLVQDDLGAGDWINIWSENPYTQVAYVGDGQNDRADRFFSCPA